MALLADLNGYVAQGRTALGTGEAISNLFGISLVDALGFNGATRISPNGGFNLENFRSKLAYQGVMRPTLFLTELPLPTTLLETNPNAWAEAQKTVMLYTDSLSLPGASWMSSDGIRHYGYGPFEQRPYNVQFQDISLGYIIDGRAEMLKFFTAWMNSIVNFDRRKGMISLNPRGVSPYEVEYKKNYAVDLKIYVFDEATNKILVCVLMDAFPQSLDPVQMNWSSVDELARLNVTWKFTDWYIESYEFADIKSGFSNGLNFFQSLEKGVTIAQTLATLTRPKTVGDVLNVVNNASIIKHGIINLF